MRFRAPYPSSPRTPTRSRCTASDGRFTHAVEALLAELGYPRLDTLTVPGGPAVLSIATASLGTFDVVRNALSFLVTGHAIAHVVLIAHDSCGYSGNTCYRVGRGHAPPTGRQSRGRLQVDPWRAPQGRR